VAELAVSFEKRKIYRHPDKEASGYLNGFYLYLYLRDYQGSNSHRMLRKAIKAFYLLWR
jgi:hypothetical protein